MASGDGASEGRLDAVTIAEMAEGVAGWRGPPEIRCPDLREGAEASLVQVQEGPAEVGASQGVAVLVGCPWVAGGGDGLEVVGKSALVGVSCQEVGALASLVGVLRAACLGVNLLQDH